MREQTAVLHDYLASLNAEADLAAVVVTALRARPLAEWPGAFDAHPEWLAFGPLNALLDLAHKEIDNDAARARDIASFVLAQADRVTFTQTMDILQPLLIGTAWKEHANALYELQLFGEAMASISRAIDILRRDAALAVDRAAGLLTYALIAHEEGDTAAALEAVDEASTVFLAHRETRRYMQALEVCGGILFDQKEYRLALDAFRTARTVAERLDDAYAMTRAELNIGQISIFVDALDEAQHYLTRALTYFEDMGMQGAVHRVVWGLGHIAKERGALNDALEALHLVYGEFLHRGRHRAAAAVLVEVCDTVTDITGDPTYARETCKQLALTMGKYDVPANVRDAVQYLQRQTQTGSVAILRATFNHVRGFLDKLLGNPLTAFAV